MRFMHFPMMWNPDEGRPVKRRTNDVPAVDMKNPSKDSFQIGTRQFIPTQNFGSGSGIKKPE